MASDDWKTRQSWTVGDFYSTTFPPLNGFLDKRIFLPGTISELTGAPGVGKSWLGLKLVDCIATATPFALMPTYPGKALFISEEMTAQEMAPRVTGFNLASNNGHLTFRFQQGVKLNWSVGVTRLYDIIAKEGARFAVLDALSDCHTTTESSNDAMKLLMMNLRDKIARPLDCHVQVIHHSGKDYGTGTGANDSRGAIAIEAVCSDILVVKRNEDGQRSLKFKKVRHGAEPESLNFEIVTNASGRTDLEFSF